MSSTRKLAGLRLSEEVLQRIDNLLRARYGHLSARFSRTAMMEHWIVRALEAEEQGTTSSPPLAPVVPPDPVESSVVPSPQVEGNPSETTTSQADSNGRWHVYRGVAVTQWGDLRLLREALGAVEDPDRRARLRALSDEAIMTARRGTLNLGGGASEARALEMTLPVIRTDGVHTEHVLVGVALPDPNGASVASLVPLSVSGARSTHTFPTRIALDVNVHILP